MKIRLFDKQDVEQIAKLFHDTIREVNINDYSINQVKAWAPDNIYFRDWVSVCSEKITYVADDNGTIAGFGELESDGHIEPIWYLFLKYKGFRKADLRSPATIRVQENEKS